MKRGFRKALLDRRLTLGTWIQIGHPACAEILARAGFDWVCVDLEHGGIDLETMTNLFRTLAGFDCTPIARLPLNDPVWIHRTLDAGAAALVVPMVNTAAEAERVVRESKYPPRGARGFGYSRANMHGADFKDYIAAANDEIAVIVQTEHKDAIANLDEILSVPGVDGSLIGPLDLSGSMGITGQLQHPHMIAALERHRELCNKHGVSAGMHIVHPTPERIRSAIEQGYTHLALGLDNVLLYEGARACLQAAGRGT